MPLCPRVRRLRAGAFSLIALATAAFGAPRGLFHPEAGRPVFRDFRPTEYRGHPQAYEFTQSREGFIYMANQEGILEFDGARWTHCPGPGAQFTRVQAAADGKIWAGGTDTFGYYERDASGLLKYHDVSEQLPPEFKPWGWNASLLIHGPAVYIAGNPGIARYENGRLTTWRGPVNSNTRLHLLDGEVVAHFSREGLHRIVGDRLEPYLVSAEVKSSSRSASARLRDGRYLFCVTSSGAFILDPRTRTLTRLPGLLDDTFRTARVNAALTLPDGSIAVGSAGHGLFFVSEDLQHVRRFDRTSGLADNAIISLATDNEGGLWIGYNSGAARISVASAVTVFDGSNGPTPGTIDVWGRHDDRLYAGTYDGLYRLEPGRHGGHGSRLVRINDQVTHVFGLHSYAGQLLIAETNGLYRLREDDSAELLVRTGINNPYNLVPSRRVPGRFYLGGGRGLTVVQHDASGWRVIGQKTDLGDAHTALVDEHGDLWLACYNSGFWRVPGAEFLTDWSQATYEQYYNGRGIPPGITWTNVTPGAHGPVFFSGRGAQRFDREKNVFVPEDRYALPGEGALMMTPSAVSGTDTWASAFKDGTIVATYPLGRVRTGTDGKLTWQTAPQEVLQEVGFAGAAVLWIEPTTEGDVLWARGYNNTIRLDLRRLPGDTPAWKTYIRFVTANGQRSAAQEGARFPFSRSPLLFEFAAPHLSAIDGLRFQTRLLGYDDDWSEPTPAPSVSFTNLLGGPFTLEVRAIDASGAVSETARLGFTVTPPWFRSPLAYGAYGLLALAFVAAFVRWRLAAGERERARLERLVTMRTAELRAEKERADQASRAKSTFLAHMSHELRTPLNGIIGYAQVLLKDAEVAGRQRERVSIVHASGLHLLRMINEVLDFSKIEAGKIERLDAPFHFEQLLRELTVAHESAALGRGLTFVLAAPADLPAHVSGDAQKLRQILDNLLSNAVKFTQQGRVTLAVSRESAGRWQFSVTDTGVGLTAGDRERLFQPFEQARSGRPAEPGTGLGLAITLRLVRLLGGELDVESEPGRGSRFHFTIPLPEVAAPHAASRPSFPIAGYAGPRRRILVVDDNAINRSLLRDLLAPLGFEISEFESAEQLLAVAPGELRADLAFLDVKLPGIDGLELARRLRAREDSRKLPIVFTSASVLTFDHATAGALGCPDFLPKPFAEPQLNELLTRLLDLDWRRAAPRDATGPRGETASPARLEQLLALADAGDISALRQALSEARREHAGDRLLPQVENAVAAYQLEQARQLLRSALT
jgi:signal transduction histidine kinase/CheY-like chemotaxis protein